MKRFIGAVLMLVLVSVFALGEAWATDFSMTLKIVDSQTKSPIPLVELEALNALVYQSDNMGRVAIVEPELIGQTVRFVVRGHGYRVPRIDLFGERSVMVKIQPGSEQVIELERTARAQRLYQITGSGRFRASLISAAHTGGMNIDLPGQVIGIDSAVPVLWEDRLLSFYGDALGPATFNLSGSGAEVDLFDPLVPDKQLSLNFFTDKNGFAKKMFERLGPFIWIETVIPVSTTTGRDALVARYVVHETLDRALETGYAIFNERKESFDTIRTYKSGRHHKSARAFPVKYGAKQAWALQPWEMVESSLGAFVRPESYLYYTCLKETVNSADLDAISIDTLSYVIDRDKAGHPLFAWRKNAVPFTPRLQAQLSKKGLISFDENWLKLVELETGKTIGDFTGSVSFNSFRNRWVMIAQGLTGEIWYSEADTFTGPWIYARRIVEHDDYNFYNPVHHWWFDADEGQKIYFEGTYTCFFTAKERKTPRTDYNQVMYSLDINSAELLIPVAVYRVKGDRGSVRLMTAVNIAKDDLWNRVEAVEFFAFEDDYSMSWLKPVAQIDGEAEYYVIDCNYSAHELAGSLNLNHLQQVAGGYALRNYSGLLTLTPKIFARQ